MSGQGPDNGKFLKAILIAFLEDKTRESKAKILKQSGFSQSEIVDICGPSESTLRVRKSRFSRKKKGGEESKNVKR